MTGMEEVFDASKSHVRHRRGVEIEKKTIPCQQDGILVISDVMLSIANVTLVGSNKIDRDSFKNGTNLVISNAVVKNESVYAKM